MRHFCKRLHLFFILFALLIPSALTHAQEPAEEPGLEWLDKAMQLKLNAVRLKDLEEVVANCQKALDAGLSEGNQAFAKQMMTSTLYETAERLVELIFEGNFDNTWARRREMAFKALRRLIQLDDKNGDAYLLFSKLCLLPRGDMDSGRAAAKNAVELLGEVPARKSEALVIESQFADNLEEQIKMLDEAIELDENNFEAWQYRGDARLMSGDTEQAIEDFKHILEKDEDNINAIEQMVRGLAANQEIDAALEQANRVIELDPESPTGYAMRSSLYLMQDKREDALDDLDSAVDRDPGNLRILMTRAGLLELNKDYEEAFADVDRVLELRPGLPEGLMLRAEIAISADRFDDAILAYKELIEREPENFDYRVQLAIIFNVDSRPRRAVELFTEILESPEISDDIRWKALQGRADVSLAIGEHASAIADYEEAMKMQPENDGILNNLAWVLATSPKDKVRDGKRSIGLAKKACELTDYEAPHILSTLAACYAETGDFEEARKWSTKAVELGEGEISEHLAEELESYKKEEPWRELQEQEENPDPEPELGLSNDLLLDEEVKNRKLDAGAARQDRDIEG